MRVKIWSKDQTTKDVLQGMLEEFGFKHIEFLAPADCNKKDFGNTEDDTLILDLDSRECRENLWKISGKHAALLMGQKPPKELQKRYTSPTGQVIFLSKPFTSSKFHQSLTSLIHGEARQETRSAPGRLESAPEPDQDTLKKLEITFESIMTRSQNTLRETQQTLATPPAKLQALVQTGKIQMEDLPLKTILVMEPDDGFANGILRYLSSRCVLEVIRVTHGLDAWNTLAERSVDLVVMEWDTSDMSGLSIYNRMRMTPNLKHTPILVTHKRKEAGDWRLVAEDFCLKVLEKPLAQEAFNKALDDVVLSSIVCRELSKSVQGFLTEAVEQGFDFSNTPPGMLRFLILSLRQTGENLLREDNLVAAERVLLLAWNLGDQSSATMTVLARIYHCQKRHQKAHRLLTQAGLLAPGSLDRLCLRGEIDLWLNRFDEALASFQEAIHMDPECRKAVAGQSMVAQIHDTPGDPRVGSEDKGVASPFNLTAIYLAREGRFREALRYYMTAWSFVHTDMDKARLLFNIGLCYKRAGKESKATEAFHKASEVSDGKFTKAAKYLEKPGEDDDELVEFDDETIAS